MDDKECLMCYEDLDKPYIIKKDCECILYFHENCIILWFSKYQECPICRIKINSLNEKYSKINNDLYISVPMQINYNNDPIIIDQNENNNEISEFQKYKKLISENKIAIITILLVLFIILSLIMIYV